MDTQVTSVGKVYQDFVRHQALAMAWVRYNSRSGRTTEKQEMRVMRQLSVSDLERMLAERGVVVR